MFRHHKLRPPGIARSRYLLWLSFALACLAIVRSSSPALAQEVPELQITSKRYIVIDADTGEVFAQRNADQQVAMASLTKIFTTVEALERGLLSQSITTDESDVFNSESSTVMGFGAGETFSLEDLLYGMMLPSGNDAAHAIARGLGAQDGDTSEAAVDRFVAAMNQRNQDMGLTETHLVRPDGWGVEGHFSSAHDLATFTMYALRYPMFVELISTSQYTTADGSYTVSNTNKMLNLYDGIIGGKTGYDDDAGYCLIEVARRGDNTMISVTLDGVAPDDWYDDNRVLLDYAFEQKEARVAANQPIAGQVVSFRDPDAARIIAQATPGGSVGAPAPTATPNAQPGIFAEVTTTATPAAGPGGVATKGGDGNNKLLVAVVVTGVVIAAGIAGSLFSHSSGNTPSAAD